MTNVCRAKGGTPNLAAMAPLVSLTRWKGSWWFFVKPRCDSSVSADTPMSTTPLALSAVHASRNAHASAVQPGVSSFG